jgi:hypothetical protein
VALTLVGAASGPTLVAASDAGVSPQPTSLTVVADGPFGRVAGMPGAADRLPDPDALSVLDAWAIGTRIRFEPTDGALAPWSVTAFPQPADAPNGQELGTGDGDAVVTLAKPGLLLLRLDGTIRPDGGAVEGTWWWRVAVPDRTLPEGETGPPPPGLRFASADDVVVLEQGSGCFLGTCGDIGGISPPDLLPTIRSIPGAPLSLALGDGSAMGAWTISVAPVDGGTADERLLGQMGKGWATHGWVPAPDPGDWVVAVSVTFDRERGHMDGYGRLIVEAADR